MSGRWGRDNLATVGTPNSGVPMMTRKKVGSDEVAAAAGLMIVSPGDLVLFLKRSPKGDHAGEWCFPGGGVENDEDPKTAAVREAREETQFIPEGELKEVDARETDGVHFTTFAVAHGNPFTPTLNDEHVGFAWAPFDDPPQPLHPGVAATLESDNFDDFVYDEDIKIVEHGGQKYVLRKTRKGWHLIRTDAPKSAKILSEPDLGKLFGIEMDAAANEASHSELTSTIKFPPKPANGERAINHAFAEGGLKGPVMRKAPKAEAWERRGGHDAKVTKDEAEYTDGPVDAEPCKDCTMFVEGGSCTKVEGEIEPLGHCKFFYAIDMAKGKDEDEIDSELEQEEIYGKKEKQESQNGQAALPEGTENNKLVPPEKKETVTTTQAAQTGLPYIDDVLNSKITKHVIDNVVVDRNHKVPYTAGGSVPLDDPTMFIDERFPEEFEADGKTWDPAYPFAVHENVEQHVMEILIKAGVPKDLAYECAHWGWAEPAEDAWYEFHGIDKDEAEALYRPHMQEIQNNPGDEDEFPSNLYRDPYPHDEPSCTTMEQLDEPRPTDEEMEKAKAIVAEFLKRDDTSHPEDVEFDSAYDSIAFDRASVRKFDMDGHLLVEVTNISKANICPYVGKEIPDAEQLGLDLEKIYQLLRDPEELEKAAPTFNGKLLLSEHVPVSADNYDTEIKKFTIGFTGQDATFEFPYLKNSLVVVSGDAIKLIESGQQKELSCGYRYKADMTPGVFQGQRYDGVMRDIIGNHVALVEEGRAGHDVVVNDSQENLEWAVVERALRKFGIDSEFKESDHPRGQPDNAGQFSSGAGGGGTEEFIKTPLTGAKEELSGINERIKQAEGEEKEKLLKYRDEWIKKRQQNIEGEYKEQKEKDKKAIAEAPTHVLGFRHSGTETKGDTTLSVYDNPDFIKPKNAIPFFHETSKENLSSILKNGLDPSFSTDGLIWSNSQKARKSPDFSLMPDEVTIEFWSPKGTFRQSPEGWSSEVPVKPEHIKSIRIGPRVLVNGVGK